MPTPREKGPSAISASKANQAGEPNAAAQSPRQGKESVPTRKSVLPGEQRDAQQISEVTTEPNTPRQATKNLPSHQEIELVAYKIYLQRGCAEGSALQDWLQAERQLLDAFELDSEKSGKTRARGA